LATYAPVSGGEAPPSGFVNGVFRLDVLIDSCFPEPQLTEAFRFSLHDEEGRLAYRSEEAQVGSLRTGDEAADWPFQATKDVRVIDRDMVLRVAPTEAHLASVKTHANDGLLAAGLMVSLLLALVLHAYLKGQRRLREREEELRQSQKVEAIGQLAGGIAHDFNNILQVILGHAELAVESRGNSNEVEENVEAIVHAAQRASSLTQQLLDFSRRRQIHPERLDINDVVEELLGLARRTIDERVEILFHPTRELPAVTGDPRQIEQVVLNLCLNARDAMPDGGRLVVETFRTAVDRTVRASYPWVEVGPMVGLRVRDEGCGMDAATLDRAFEPFFTTKEVGQGTGLGLSSAYGIVRQHGGLIRATSAPGRGTSVEVLLPPAA
jgi:signal transduction histidine kinase